MGIIVKEWVVITRQHRVIRYAQKNMQSVCIKKWEVTGMNNYLVIKDAVEQFEITQYALRKAIKNGQVRHFVTKLLPINIPVMMVYAEDIKTYNCCLRAILCR